MSTIPVKDPVDVFAVRLSVPVPLVFFPTTPGTRPNRSAKRSLMSTQLDVRMLSKIYVRQS